MGKLLTTFDLLQNLYLRYLGRRLHFGNGILKIQNVDAMLGPKTTMGVT